MQRAYRNALTAGTWRNRRRQADSYIAFCHAHSANPLRPRDMDVAAYAVALGKRYKAHATVKNYISGLRAWLVSNRAPTEAVESHLVTMTKAGLQKASTHTPIQAPPLTPVILKRICRYLDTNKNTGRLYKAIFLLTYHTLLRQSNVLVTSSLPWGARHTLRARDIIDTGAGVNVTVCSSKTIKASHAPTLLQIPSAPKGKYCPVLTWRRYKRTFSPPSAGPAFITKRGRPVTVQMATNKLRQALRAVGARSPTAYTLHSLRRGAAQACAGAGAGIDDIKALGTWTSAAVYAYVPKIVPPAAAATLSNLFG